MARQEVNDNEIHLRDLLDNNERNQNLSPIGSTTPSVVLMLEPAAEPNTPNFEKNNVLSEINEKIIEHNVLLSYSKKIGVFWISIALISWFFFCCRWYIWILYARSLAQSNETYLAFSVYSVYFIQAFSNLGWGWVADQYSYDIVGLILAFCVLIGLILESVAVNFIWLLIGTIIVDIFRAHNALALAFLTKYLPNYYAVKYQSLRMALIGAANLLGPIVGGIFVTYFGLRSPFYLSTIVAALSFLFLFFAVYGTQTKIHSQQAEFKHILYDLLSNENETDNNLTNIEYQFPVSTDKYIQQKQKQKEQEQKTNFKSAIPVLTKYEWFYLINILLSNGCIVSIEGAFATYFVVFCIDLFNVSIIESTLMISLMAFIYIITCIVTRKCIQKYKNADPDNFMVEFILIIVICTLMIVVTFFSKNFIYIVGEFWLWILVFMTGLAIGINNMLQEIIILTIQPKQHAGKISGAKIFARNMGRAFITFIIGVLWSFDIYYFLYVQTAFYLIVLLSTILMMIMAKKKKTQK